MEQHLQKLWGGAGREGWGEQWKMESEKGMPALTGAAQGTGHSSANQKVSGSSASQDIHLGFGPTPQWMFLSLSFSLSSPLSKNKYFLKERKKKGRLWGRENILRPVPGGPGSLCRGLWLLNWVKWGATDQFWAKKWQKRPSGGIK